MSDTTLDEKFWLVKFLWLTVAMEVRWYVMILASLCTAHCHGIVAVNTISVFVGILAIAVAVYVSVIVVYLIAIATTIYICCHKFDYYCCMCCSQTLNYYYSTDCYYCICDCFYCFVISVYMQLSMQYVHSMSSHVCMIANAAYVIGNVKYIALPSRAHCVLYC